MKQAFVGAHLGIAQKTRLQASKSQQLPVVLSNSAASGEHTQDITDSACFRKSYMKQQWVTSCLKVTRVTGLRNKSEQV